MRLRGMVCICDMACLSGMINIGVLEWHDKY
jgi:hypothetical protein